MKSSVVEMLELAKLCMLHCTADEEVGVVTNARELCPYKSKDICPYLLRRA
jgi:hypothetical protein